MGSLPYQPYEHDSNSLLHWGQRKLLLAEIEFLLICAKDPISSTCNTVVYVGAASGAHLTLLFQLFPNIKFILVDPAKFNKKVTKYAKQHPLQVTILPTFFENVNHKKQFPDKFLLISDIRNRNITKQHKENNLVVQQDMQKQLKWVLDLHPVRSMLKFRLPFPEFHTHYEYIAGDIYLPIWGPPGTAECKLITHSNNYNLHVYNCLQYEQQMRYFNVVMRPTVFHQALYDGCCGYDQCYDCYAEQQVLKNVLPDINLGYICHSISNCLLSKKIHLLDISDV